MGQQLNYVREKMYTKQVSGPFLDVVSVISHVLPRMREQYPFVGLICGFQIVSLSIIDGV